MKKRSLSAIQNPRQVLLRQMRRYVNRLIQNSPRTKSLSFVMPKQEKNVLHFLKKCKHLGDTESYVRLLDHFGDDLPRSNHLREVEQHLATVLAHAGLTHRQRVEFACLRAHLLARLGNLEQAQEVLDAMWSFADTPVLKAGWYNRRGMLLAMKGDYHASVHVFKLALQMLASEEQVNLRAVIYNNLGNLNYMQKHYMKAFEYYSTGLTIIQEKSEHLATQAMLEEGLAMTLGELGKYEEAHIHHTMARQAYEQVGHLFGLVRVDLNLSYQALAQHEVEEAKKLAGSVLKIAQKLGDQQRLSTAWHNLGRAHLLDKQYELALECFSKALDIRRWLSKPLYTQQTLDEIKKLTHLLETNTNEALS